MSEIIFLITTRIACWRNVILEGFSVPLVSLGILARYCSFVTFTGDLTRPVVLAIVADKTLCSISAHNYVAVFRTLLGRYF